MSKIEISGCWIASVRYQKIQTNVCAWLSEKRETTISPLQKQKTRLTSGRAFFVKSFIKSHRN